MCRFKFLVIYGLFLVCVLNCHFGLYGAYFWIQVLGSTLFLRVSYKNNCDNKLSTAYNKSCRLEPKLLLVCNFGFNIQCYKRS